MTDENSLKQKSLEPCYEKKNENALNIALLLGFCTRIPRVNRVNAGKNWWIFNVEVQLLIETYLYRSVL